MKKQTGNRVKGINIYGLLMCQVLYWVIKISFLLFLVLFIFHLLIKLILKGRYYVLRS